MATPLVAGSLALIAQYFKEGWYPGGAPNKTMAFSPSSSLMKAVLLGELKLLHFGPFPMKNSVVLAQCISVD